MSFVNRHSYPSSPIPPLSLPEIRRHCLLTQPQVSNNVLPILLKKDLTLGTSFHKYIQLHVLGVDIVNLENLFTKLPLNPEGIRAVLHGLCDRICSFLRSDFRSFDSKIFEILPGLSRQLPPSITGTIEICIKCGQQGHSILSCHTTTCPHCQLIAPGHLPEDCLAKSFSPTSQTSRQGTVQPQDENQEAEEETPSGPLLSPSLIRTLRQSVQELFPPTSTQSSDSESEIQLPSGTAPSQETQHPLSSTRGAARIARRSARLARRTQAQRSPHRRHHSLGSQQESSNSLAEVQLGENSVVLDETRESNRLGEE